MKQIRGWAAVRQSRQLQSRRPAATLSALALGVVVITLTGLSAGAAARAKNPVSADMAGLVTSYSANTGLIGSSWWQAAVAVSTIETYVQATGDTRYDTFIANAFALNSRGDFENNSDDDTGWWALAWLQAYQITHIPAYLSMAETDADYIHQDWDNTCGGGLWWQRDPRSYKNAITNELFLELTAWLHNSIPGDVKYLTWAEAEWSWFDHSGMINSSDLINDGLDAGCANNGDVIWTYNQGVILAGLAQLYLATGNRSLLVKAERIASAAIGQLTVHGVLAEPCEGTACQARLDADTQAFKGIFVRDLRVLAGTARTKRFNRFFTRQANAIQAHDSSGKGQFGIFWDGPVADVSAASQASALNALIAAAKLPLRFLRPLVTELSQQLQPAR